MARAMGLAGLADAGGGRCRALLLLCLAVHSLLPAAAGVQRRDGKLGSVTDPGFPEGDESLQTRGRDSASTSTRSSSGGALSDSCEFAHDGECDEPKLCDRGTDTSDCFSGGDVGTDGGKTMCDLAGDGSGCK